MFRFAVWQDILFNSEHRFPAPLQDQKKGRWVLWLVQFHMTYQSFLENRFKSQEETSETKPWNNRISLSKSQNFLKKKLPPALRKAYQRISPTKTTLWRIVRHELYYRFLSLHLSSWRLARKCARTFLRTLDTVALTSGHLLATTP